MEERRSCHSLHNCLRTSRSHPSQLRSNSCCSQSLSNEFGQPTQPPSTNVSIPSFTNNINQYLSTAGNIISTQPPTQQLQQSPIVAKSSGAKLTQQPLTQPLSSALNMSPKHQLQPVVPHSFKQQLPAQSRSTTAIMTMTTQKIYQTGSIPCAVPGTIVTYTVVRPLHHSQLRSHQSINVPLELDPNNDIGGGVPGGGSAVFPSGGSVFTGGSSGANVNIDENPLAIETDRELLAAPQTLDVDCSRTPVYRHSTTQHQHRVERSRSAPYSMLSAMAYSSPALAPTQEQQAGTSAASTIVPQSQLPPGMAIVPYGSAIFSTNSSRSSTSSPGVGFKDRSGHGGMINVSGSRPSGSDVGGGAMISRSSSCCNSSISPGSSIISISSNVSCSSSDAPGANIEGEYKSHRRHSRSHHHSHHHHHHHRRHHHSHHHHSPQTRHSHQSHRQHHHHHHHRHHSHHHHHHRSPCAHSSAERRSISYHYRSDQKLYPLDNENTVIDYSEQARHGHGQDYRARRASSYREQSKSEFSTIRKLVIIIIGLDWIVVLEKISILCFIS